MYIKKKLKIGILTFHNGINHGAYLQCCALFKLIESLGYEVEFINYKNFRHWINDYKCLFATKNLFILINPFILINKIKRIIKFHNFQKKFKTSGSLTFFHKSIKKRRYDVIIVGSDVVWNFKNFLFGFDSIYFGNDLNAEKIISYATSFDTITNKDIPPQLVINGLKKFNAISVRDSNSKELIYTYLGKNADTVLDPTFLYDFSGEEVACPCNDFILVYAYFVPDKIKNQVIDFAKRENKKIISIGFYHSWCDKNVIALGPFEWLGYFENADYIITNTFHGTIFSIKYKKYFLTIDSVDLNNRLIGLLKRLRLEDRLINNDPNINKIKNQIDYIEVDRMLSKEILNSTSFLNNALKS